MQLSPTWRHQLTRQGGTATLALAGELDLACASAVQALLFEQVECPEVEQIHVDLAQVSFLDSTALGVLVSGLQHAQEQGRGFAVIDPSPPAQRIFALTGLDEVLIEH